MKRVLTKSFLVLIVFAGFALPVSDIDLSKVFPMFAPGHGDYPVSEPARRLAGYCAAPFPIERADCATSDG